MTVGKKKWNIVEITKTHLHVQQPNEAKLSETI